MKLTVNLKQVPTKFDIEVVRPLYYYKEILKLIFNFSGNQCNCTNHDGNVEMSRTMVN